MVIKVIVGKKVSGKNLPRVEPSKILVGYPEGGTRSDSELTNAQIAFLNTKGTRPNKASKAIANDVASGLTYSDALSAYMRSFGDPRWHIPPRPFIEPAIEANWEAISKRLKAISIAKANGQDTSQLEDELGLFVVNKIQRFIRDYPANGLEPNAPSTIKEKGVDHPLIGTTGQLIRGVTYVKP